MSWHYKKFFRRVRRFFFEQTQVALYKPIIRQNLPQKVARIYQDKSFILNGKQSLAEESAQRHQKENKILLIMYTLLFSHKKCTSPLENVLLLWYVFVVTAVLYFFVEVGIILTFGEGLWIQEKGSSQAYATHILFLVILCLDIIVQFRTGYLYRGMLILQRQRVIAHYLRYRFQLDIFIITIIAISIPFQPFWINYIKTIIILKFNRIFEIDQLYLRRLSVHRKWKMAYVIFKQVVIIFVLSHIIGVIFYWIDFYYVNSDLCSPTVGNPSLCWLNSSTAYSPIIELSWNIQYFYIIYWGVSTITTISYGDIAANNPIQSIYVTAMMCFGFVVYAYIVNSIIQILLWARSKSDQIKSEMIIIDIYMNDLNIDREMKNEVTLYLMFLHKQEMDRDQELQSELMDKLPVELRLELVKSAYSVVYESLQYMLQLGDSVGTLLFSIKQQIYTINQEVIIQDTLVDRLFFIFKGEVRLDCQYYGKNNHLGIVQSVNQYIAQKEFFMQEKVKYTVRVQKSSSFYYIEREVFENECQKNLSFRESLRYLEYCINVKRNYSKILYTCPFCHEGHLWNLCPKKFPVFHQVKLKDSQQSKKEGLRARMRKDRHHTWRDIGKLCELQILCKLNQDEFYGRIGKRLMKIKDKIVTTKQLFEIDVAHDWLIYLPDENLSKIREKKHDSNTRRKISNIPAFRANSQMPK